MINWNFGRAIVTVAAMVSTTIAQADAFYSFRHSEATFDFETQQFVPANWAFQSPFAACQAGGRECSQAFLVSDPQAAGLTPDPTVEAITLIVGTKSQAGSAEWYFYFPKGAFGSTGAHREAHGSGTLYVSTLGFAPPVPEPKAIYLMSAGISLILIFRKIGPKRRKHR